MRIGVYGGTFNPIHRGHLTAARAAADALGLEKVLLIPDNLPPHKALPAFGVYACYLETSGGIFPAVVNVGRHPTLPEGHVTVEAHVLDEFLSLYGRNVRLTFLKFMRPEQKFDSIETLRAQIAHDADDCRAYFAQLQ